MENTNNQETTQAEAEQTVAKAASTVLGNSQTQYVDQYDPELLVTFGRNDSLISSNVDIEYPYEGYDIWNMWEVSFLLDNNMPIHGVGKLVIDAKSPEIIESKSMKLYFFSFSMYKLGGTKAEAIAKLKRLVEMDISSRVGVPVKFSFTETPFDAKGPFDYDAIIKSTNINDMVDVESIVIENFNEAPQVLEVVERESLPTIEAARDGISFYTIPSVKSNCKVTHQADFATGIIVIQSEKYTIDPASLIKYISSFRKEFHFHEEATHMAYDRITRTLKAVDPKAEIFVMFQYTRRGGIDINPIRSSSNKPFDDSIFKMLIDVNTPWLKTNQQ